MQSICIKLWVCDYVNSFEELVYEMLNNFTHTSIRDCARTVYIALKKRLRFDKSQIGIAEFYSPENWSYKQHKLVFDIGLWETTMVSYRHPYWGPFFKRICSMICRPYDLSRHQTASKIYDSSVGNSYRHKRLSMSAAVLSRVCMTNWNLKSNTGRLCQRIGVPSGQTDVWS